MITNFTAVVEKSLSSLEELVNTSICDRLVASQQQISSRIDEKTFPVKLGLEHLEERTNSLARAYQSLPNTELREARPYHTSHSLNKRDR